MTPWKGVNPVAPPDSDRALTNSPRPFGINSARRPPDSGPVHVAPVLASRAPRRMDNPASTVRQPHHGRPLRRLPRRRISDSSLTHQDHSLDRAPVTFSRSLTTVCRRGQRHVPSQAVSHSSSDAATGARSVPVQRHRPPRRRPRRLTRLSSARASAVRRDLIAAGNPCAEGHLQPRSRACDSRIKVKVT